ncbi:Ubiquitin-like protein 5 [Porphyridium purpureum]|uniref:Ubiquitin-like protein 5 n=1 Tax=Porphyridium purpureum TaxID=35688 RepID=A0A5J4YXG4_PORPP|nr:Ubiquitin-like protein 5 [Porphyridium purpureum]|eukprot:POR3897..scf209_3
MPAHWAKGLTYLISLALASFVLFTVKCNPDDTIGDLKRMLSLLTGTRADKIRIQKGYIVYKDHVSLQDYEISHGSSLEMYYQ